MDIKFIITLINTKIGTINLEKWLTKYGDYDTTIVMTGWEMIKCILKK